VIESSAAVTAVSRSLKDDTYTNFSTNKEIQVIPNFVCMHEYDDIKHNEILKKQIAPQGECILTHTSNFRPVKRIGDTR